MKDFDSIYREFQPKVERSFSCFCGEIDTDDITLTVFLKICKSLNDFRGESSLATWICRIVTKPFLNKKVALQTSKLKGIRGSLMKDIL
jgi:DNA-directed RNA polymerase specialized sigma24 family protein